MSNDENEPLVQGLCFIIQRENSWASSLLTQLEKLFGPISYRGGLFSFTSGTYYYPEMGSPLYRGVLSFSRLWNCSDLVEAKWKARELEQELAKGTKREFNLDVGYFDQDKLVLASFKRSGPKLYIEKGVYADMLLLYQKGGFVPFAWTFPDFKSNVYYKDLLAIRERYKKSLRQG